MSIFVQGTSSTVFTPGSSASAQFSSKNTPGNTIVVVGWNQTTSADVPLSVADDNGDLFTVYPNGHHLFLAVAPNIRGNTRATVTYKPTSTPSELDLIIAEYIPLGVDRTLPNNGFGTAITTGNLTTLLADFLLFAVGETGGAISLSGVTSGYNLDVTSTNFISLYSNPTKQPPGTYSAAATLGTAQNWATMLAGLDPQTNDSCPSAWGNIFQF